MTIFHSFCVLPIPVCHYNGINHLLFIAEHWKLQFFPFDLFVGQQVHNLSRCMDVCTCCEFADSHKTSLVNYYLYQSCHYFHFMPKLNSTAVRSHTPLAVLCHNCSNAAQECKTSSLALQKPTQIKHLQTIHCFQFLLKLGRGTENVSTVSIGNCCRIACYWFNSWREMPFHM